MVGPSQGSTTRGGGGRMNADAFRCYRCGRSMPTGCAFEVGRPVCIPHQRLFEGDCHLCGHELTKSEAWAGDVCFTCRPPSEEEIRMVLDADGIIEQRKEASPGTSSEREGGFDVERRFKG